MQSWAEEIGGGRIEPRGDGAAPVGREPVGEDDQAVAADHQTPSADHEPVAADDQSMATEYLPVAADHQAGAADDQAASADHEPVAANDQAVATDDHPVSADELVIIVTEDNQDGTAAADDAGDTPASESEPDLAAFVHTGAPAAGRSPSAFAGSHADDTAAGGAVIGGTPAPDESQPIADEATPAITAGFSPEAGPAQGAGSVSTAGRWPEIQAMFVDDPRASVEMAADLVDDSLEAFIASVKQFQSSLRSTWGSSEADTEHLRKTLQRYRACWRQLHSISIEP